MWKRETDREAHWQWATLWQQVTDYFGKTAYFRGARIFVGEIFYWVNIMGLDKQLRDHSQKSWSLTFSEPSWLQQLLKHICSCFSERQQLETKNLHLVHGYYSSHLEIHFICFTSQLLFYPHSEFSLHYLALSIPIIAVTTSAKRIRKVFKANNPYDIPKRWGDTETSP